jgi:uncharacterized protein involved in exopolysaccharide biosynthesis
MATPRSIPDTENQLPDLSAPEVYRFAARLLRSAKTHWARVVALAVMGGLAGVGASFLLPSYYEASTSLESEATSSFPMSGALATLGQLAAGISLGGQQDNPQLLETMLSTNTVLGQVTAGRYMWKGQLRKLSEIYRYTGPEPKVEYRTINRLRKSITTTVNLRTAVIDLTVEARSPELALALAESLVVALNDANLRLRRNRAAAEQEFTAARAADVKRELNEAEVALSRFYERNRNITNAPSLQMEEVRLQRNVEMSQQLYSQLRVMEAQAGIKAVMNTPTISAIDPPRLPVKKSRPSRKLALLGGFMIGLAAATFWLLRLEKKASGGWSPA